MASLLDNAVLVRNFEFCDILQIMQTEQPLYVVQTNYNSHVLDTTHDIEDAVEIATKHDERIRPDRPESEA